MFEYSILLGIVEVKEDPGANFGHGDVGGSVAVLDKVFPMEGGSQFCKEGVK